MHHRARSDTYKEHGSAELLNAQDYQVLDREIENRFVDWEQVKGCSKNIIRKVVLNV